MAELKIVARIELECLPDQTGNKQYAKVDLCDSNAILQYKWSIGQYGYATTTINGKKVTMQQMIASWMNLHVPLGFLICHVNKNVLDNTRNNLVSGI